MQTGGEPHHHHHHHHHHQHPGYAQQPRYWWPADQPWHHQEEGEGGGGAGAGGEGGGAGAGGEGGAYRGRCNTWPSSQSWDSSQSHSPGLASLPEEATSQTEGETEAGDSRLEETPYGRRNPWGPFSYAQLITQAICSQPDQRMTLNQIYEFLISNFPYFAERRSHQQSAGWKVKLYIVIAGQWLEVVENFIINFRIN